MIDLLEIWSEAVFERLRSKPTGGHIFMYAFDLLEHVVGSVQVLSEEIEKRWEHRKVGSEPTTIGAIDFREN